MKRAFRIASLHIRVMLRSTQGIALLLMPIAGVFAIMMVYSLFRQIGLASMHPQDLIPVTAGAFNILLIMLFSTYLGAAFSNLYLSKDMPLLLASPVRPRHVILSKVFEIATLGSAPFWIVAVPLLMGFGKAWYARPWFFPLGLIAALPMALLPAMLAIVLNLAVARLIPPTKAKEMLAAMSSLMGGVIYLLLRLSNSALRATSVVNPQNAVRDSLTAVFTKWGPSWSPSILFARALCTGLLDKPLPLLMAGGLLIAACAAGFWLVVPWTERAYVSGWATFSEGRSWGRTSPRIKPSISEDGLSRPATSFLGRFSTEFMAFRVEARLLLRDLQAQSNVLYLLLMMVGWSVIPSGNNGASSSLSPVAIVATFMSLGGTYTSWSLRTASETSRILRASPSDPARVMRGKAAFYGTVQAVCILAMLGAMALLGKIDESLTALPAIALGLSFSTAAVTVCGISAAPNTFAETGQPRVAFGIGLVIFVVNGIMSGTGMIVLAIMGREQHAGRPGVATLFLLLFYAIQGIVFNTAANIARGYVRGEGDPVGGGGQ